MGKNGAVNVRMKHNKVKDSVFGAKAVYQRSTHHERNVNKGDKFSGQGSFKVGGNVKKLSMKNITGGAQHDENEQSEHEESDATSDSEEEDSPQTRMVEPVPPTSDIGEDVAMILAHQPEDDIRNVEASLRSLAVYSVQGLKYVKETDLTKAGIKLVHARMLMDYYDNNFSEQKKSKDATQSPSKAKSNVGRKRTSPDGKQKNPKKTRTASAKKKPK